MKLVSYFVTLLLINVLGNNWQENLEYLIKQRKGNEALKLINELLLDNPNDLLIKVYKARCLSVLKQYQESESLLQQVLREQNDQIDAKLALGLLYMNNNKWNQAENLLQAVLQQDNENYVALASLAKIWAGRDHNISRAQEYLFRARSINPTDERVLFDLGMLFLQEGRFQEGKEAFDAIDMSSSSLDHKLIARIYLHYGQHHWAAVSLRKHLGCLSGLRSDFRVDSASDSQAQLLLGQCEEVLGHSDVAETIYLGIIEREPSNAQAHASLGLLLLGTGARNYGASRACGLHQQEALRHLRFAVSLDPDMKGAAEAIEYCSEELVRLQQWRDVVVERRNSTSASTSKTLARATSIPLTSPVRWALQLARTLLLRLHITRFICEDDGLMKRLLGWVCVDSVTAGRSSGGSTVKEDPEEALENAKAERRQHWRRRESAGLGSVPVLSTPPSHRDFMEGYVLENTPVVIRGAQAGWGGEEGRDTFSTAALERTFGDNVVHVSVSQTGRFDGPEAGPLWGLDEDVDVLVRPPGTTMLFKDFLELSTRRTNASLLSETFYLEYLAVHQYLGQAFGQLIPLPEFVTTTTAAEESSTLSPKAAPPFGERGVEERREYPMEHLLTNLWIGAKPTVSPLHYDDYENLLCQIRGYKELILFPPRDLPNLYYEARPKGPLRYEYPGRFERDVVAVDAAAVVFGSSVHVDEPDLRKHPRYARTRPLRVVLQPGDILYLPSYWHHEVQSLPDEGDLEYRGLSVAVNFWFANMTAPIDELALFGINFNQQQASST